MIATIRGFIFYTLLYFVIWLILLPTLPLACLPNPKLFYLAQRAWIFITLKAWEITAGLRHEIRGKEYIATNPVLYAAKHQSVLEIAILRHAVPSATFVTKRILLWLPIVNIVLWRYSAIGIDRSAGRAALKKLIKGAKRALSRKHPLVIFPEGTRTNIDEVTVYHTGIFYIYDQLQVSVIPVATNAGYFCPRHKIATKTGTATLEFLEPIAPGLQRKEFMTLLEERIEVASTKLLNEVRQ